MFSFGPAQAFSHENDRQQTKVGNEVILEVQSEVVEFLKAPCWVCVMQSTGLIPLLSAAPLAESWAGAQGQAEGAQVLPECPAAALPLVLVVVTHLGQLALPLADGHHGATGDAAASVVAAAGGRGGSAGAAILAMVGHGSGQRGGGGG